MTYAEWQSSLLSFKLNTWGWQQRLGEEGRVALAKEMFGKKPPEALFFVNEDLEMAYEVLPITEEGERIEPPSPAEVARARSDWEAAKNARRAAEKKAKGAKKT